MQVIDTIEAWRKALDEERAAGRTVGLVPTMGALHAGHASLIDAAARECDVVGVTVFVNPLQFAAGEDLDAYPRTLDSDVGLASANGAAYHAAACVAANHLVALLAQVERVAAAAGVPAQPFYALAAATLANARDRGAGAALTGPAARGDVATIERHLDTLDPAEHALYLALASAAAELGGRSLPEVSGCR